MHKHTHIQKVVNIVWNQTQKHQCVNKSPADWEMSNIGYCFAKFQWPVKVPDHMDSSHNCLTEEGNKYSHQDTSADLQDTQH